jgi:glycosyltransferase involved in cell wall biosynthesis
VTVITCAPNVPNGKVYDGYRNRLWPQREVIDGIDVLRVWTYVAPNAGSVKRIGNFLSYMFSAVIGFVFFCSRPNIIIATSPQFFCAWAGIFASWLKWRPLIIEIRDIWPESIVTVGAMRKGFIVRFLEWLEKRMYRQATHIVAVGAGYRDNIVSKVPVSNRITVVTNGVDFQTFQPKEKSAEFLRRWNLRGKFTCAYVGTIGMAHGLEVVLAAAEKLKQSPDNDIAFLLVGDGARRAELERRSEQLGVTDLVKFTGLLPKASVPDVLASCDCMLVHLKKSELFETVIPSKIFETMAMEKPLIMGVRGESAAIVRRGGCGIEMEPENPDQLISALRSLRGDQLLYKRLSSSGRAFVIREYSRDRLASDFLDIILQVAN